MLLSSPDRSQIRNCKDCGKEIRVFNTLQNRCRDCTIKRHKPIKQRGPKTLQWEKFRDTVARPHLDRRDGIACHKCGVMPPKKEDGTYYRHDVEHTKKRGSHADLKFDVSLMVYLCRDCHIEETDTLRSAKIA